MPRIMEYIPPNKRQKLGVASDTLREQRARKQLYNTNYNYYVGNQDRQLDIKDKEPDDNVVFNIAKTALDREISFIYADVPKFILDDDTSDDTPDEKWLREALDYSGGMSFLFKLALNGALSGHMYARILPPRENYDPYPRVIPLDPRTVTTYWKADDIDTIIFHSIEWQVGDYHVILDVVNDAYLEQTARDEFAHMLDNDLIQADITDRVVGTPLLIDSPDPSNHWTLLEYRSRPGGPLFELRKVDRWNSAFSPIVHAPYIPNPIDFYGWSSFEADDKKAQDSINLLGSELMRIIRYHASPRTIAKGADPQDIQETGIDYMWTIPENADIVNLEMKSDLQSSITLLTFMYDQFLTQKRVVLLRGEVKDFQRVTNTGVATVFMDMLSKNKLLRSQARRLLINICQRLGLVGLGRPLIPTVEFADPLPMDRSERVKNDIMEIEAGTLSRQESIVKDGRDPERVFNNIKEEKEMEFLPGNAPKPEMSVDDPLENTENENA